MYQQILQLTLSMRMHAVHNSIQGIRKVLNSKRILYLQLCTSLPATKRADTKASNRWSSQIPSIEVTKCDNQIFYLNSVQISQPFNPNTFLDLKMNFWPAWEVNRAWAFLWRTKPTVVIYSKDGMQVYCSILTWFEESVAFCRPKSHVAPPKL